MITVLKDNGDVRFLNEKQFVSIYYLKNEKCVRGFPVQPTSSELVVFPPYEIHDVKQVAYTSDAQQVHFIFPCEER